MLLGLLEHVTDTCSTHADEHLDEVRTGDREERYLCLSGNRLRQQGLAGTRRADHQHALGNTATEFLELGRVAQELDQFEHFLLGLVATGDIGKGDRIG